MIESVVSAHAEFAGDSPGPRAFVEGSEGVSSTLSLSGSRSEDGRSHAVQVLLVGVHPELQLHLRHRLLALGWTAREAVGGAAALYMLEQQVSDVAVVASSLPDLDSGEFQQLLKAQFPAMEVLSLDSFVEADSDARPGLGESPHDPPSCLTVNPAAIAPKTSPSTGAGDLAPSNWGGIVGATPAMHRVFRTASLVARRETTVLISGESGTGKDVLARAIHNASSRAQRPYVVINCAAIPETMLEAELFGYTKGAFTGAAQSSTGRIQAAHGGTLFLDEIGDMPLPLQSKILRFLEQGELQRIGSTDSIKVDCRILAATNANLREQIKTRQFREDLYYRLAVMPIEVPPLRDRLSDLPALCVRFLERFCPGAVLHPGALELLTQHCWPGNIRELRNVMERASLFADGRLTIIPDDIVL